MKYTILAFLVFCITNSYGQGRFVPIVRAGKTLKYICKPKSVVLPKNIVKPKVYKLKGSYVKLSNAKAVEFFYHKRLFYCNRLINSKPGDFKYYRNPLHNTKIEYYTKYQIKYSIYQERKKIINYNNYLSVYNSKSKSYPKLGNKLDIEYLTYDDITNQYIIDILTLNKVNKSCNLQDAYNISVLLNENSYGSTKFEELIKYHHHPVSIEYRNVDVITKKHFKIPENMNCKYLFYNTEKYGEKFVLEGDDFVKYIENLKQNKNSCLDWELCFNGNNYSLVVKCNQLSIEVVSNGILNLELAQGNSKIAVTLDLFNVYSSDIGYVRNVCISKNGITDNFTINETTFFEGKPISVTFSFGSNNTYLF